MDLTPKQQAFADYYIECGNATEAAKNAGYSEKTARSQGQRLLTNVDVSAYIADRMKALAEKRIASADEAMEFLTSVMRGEIKDQFGLDAALSDRIKACEGLIKRFSIGGFNRGGTKREDDPLSKALKEEAERMNRGDFS